MHTGRLGPNDNPNASYQKVTQDYQKLKDTQIGCIFRGKNEITVKDLTDLKTSNFIGKFFTQLKLVFQGKGWITENSLNSFLQRTPRFDSFRNDNFANKNFVKQNGKSIRTNVTNIYDDLLKDNRSKANRAWEINIFAYKVLTIVDPEHYKTY